MYTRRCEIDLWQLSGPNAQCFTKEKKKLDSYFWEKQHHSKNNKNERKYKNNQVL